MTDERVYIASNVSTTREAADRLLRAIDAAIAEDPAREARLHYFSSGTLAARINGEPPAGSIWQEHLAVEVGLALWGPYKSRPLLVLDLLARRGYLATFVLRQKRQARYYREKAPRDALLAAISAYTFAGAKGVLPWPYPAEVSTPKRKPRRKSPKP